MVERTFKELEHQAWLMKADVYRDAFGKITERAIKPILDTFGDLVRKRLLDIACGTGELTSEAAARGAISEGLDFAATMVETAKQKYSGIQFLEGDAENLPFADGTFDAVVCSFGLLHLQDPDKAIGEVRRVLKAGGRYTFTSWCGPDQGGDFFKILIEAIQKHGTFDVPLPPAPPLFRFGDIEECRNSFLSAGFVAPSVQIIELEWSTQSASDIVEFVYKNMVRTSMVLQMQTERAKEEIHRSLIEGAESYRREDVIRLRFPATLATART